MKNNPYQRTYTKLLNNFKALNENVRSLPVIPYTEGQLCVKGKRYYCLNETLTKTFPTLKTIDYVNNTLSKFKPKGEIKYFINDFNLNDLGYDHHIADSVNFVIEGQIMTQELYDTLIQSFELCGYYLSDEYWTEGRKEFVTQFEPKFQDEFYNNNEIGDELYHVTTINHLNKIKKIGFIPKSTNKKFNYPPRCYFFTIKDIEFMKWFMLNSAKTKQGQDCAVLTINTNLIKNNIRFYTDKLFDGGIAVYTYDNIPSSAIVNVEQFKI